MPDFQGYLDLGSKPVVVLTFVLFIAAIFFKGIGHYVLLEGGVFLVSVRLIILAHKNSVIARQLADRFDGLHATLARPEYTFESRRPFGEAVGPPNRALQPTGTAHRPEETKGG